MAHSATRAPELASRRVACVCVVYASGDRLLDVDRVELQFESSLSSLSPLPLSSPQVQAPSSRHQAASSKCVLLLPSGARKGRRRLGQTVFFARASRVILCRARQARSLASRLARQLAPYYICNEFYFGPLRRPARARGEPGGGELAKCGPKRFSRATSSPTLHIFSTRAGAGR